MTPDLTQLSTIEAAHLQAELMTMSEVDLIAYARRLEWSGLLAREDQLPPEDVDWFTWLLLGGRGSGKTRCGAEYVWWENYAAPIRTAIVGPTFGDVRKTQFEGESGLLARIPEQLIQNYNRTSLEMWLTNGSYLAGYSSEEPERLRGPQFHLAWCDELAAWKYMDETMDMLLFGLRLGDNPRIVATTTPKPVKLIRQLLKDEDCHVDRVSTFANSKNLAAKALEKLKKKYEGTRLGRQELDAEVIDDDPFALWKRDMIDRHRLRACPPIRRTIVAVDPPATSGEEADECGITVTAQGLDDPEQYYVLHDASCQGLSPEGWASRVRDMYRAYDADTIVAEVNNGGAMVASTIRNMDSSLPVVQVHATRGKVRRAEPIAMLYEQGKIHHVGDHGKLEDQMCDFTTDFDPRQKGYSPDRVDSLVWGLTELTTGVSEMGSRRV